MTEKLRMHEQNRDTVKGFSRKKNIHTQYNKEGNKGKIEHSNQPDRKFSWKRRLSYTEEAKRQVS